MSSAEVSTLPTSTTNITGFLIIQRGFNLRTESISAGPTICEFQRLVFFVMFVRLVIPLRASGSWLFFASLENRWKW